MKLTGLILVPLLSSCLAMGRDFAWAAEVYPDKASPVASGSDPTRDLESRRPAPNTSEVPAAVRSRIPATPTHPSPYVVENRRPATQTLLQLPPQISITPPPKHPTSPVKFGSPVRPQFGGGNSTTTISIVSLPFADSANTCSSADNYTAPCAPAGSPDVAYTYSPQANGCIRATLCGSTYDTELSVAEDSPNNVIACNDDFCGASSELDNVPVAAGHTYYIIVDGFAGSCGVYRLLVDNCPPPPQPVYCPPEARAEGEPL